MTQPGAHTMPRAVSSWAKVSDTEPASTAKGFLSAMAIASARWPSGSPEVAVNDSTFTVRP